MKSVNTIRTNLIDKILSIQNVEFLKALDNLVSSSSQENTVKLTEEQKLMLQMSEEDILAGRIVSQEKIDLEDIKWLKNK